MSLIKLAADNRYFLNVPTPRSKNAQYIKAFYQTNAAKKACPEEVMTKTDFGEYDT